MYIFSIEISVSQHVLLYTSWYTFWDTKQISYNSKNVLN